VEKDNRKLSGEVKRSQSKSKSRSSSREAERTARSKSRSRERSTSSPHGSIVKRLGSDASATPPTDKSALTPREKMKLRMQKLLNKQIKSDKKVEEKKKVIKEQETEERDNEIYEMSRMMREKYRDKKRYDMTSPVSSPSNHNNNNKNNNNNGRTQSGRNGELPSFDASSFRYEGND